MIDERQVPAVDPRESAELIRLDPDERSRVLVELWADLFRHLSTLGAAGIAGLLVLLEVEVVSPTGRFWAAMACMAMGTLAAFSGSISTVKMVAKGQGTMTELERVVLICAALLGLGAGIFVYEVMAG